MRDVSERYEGPIEAERRQRQADREEHPNDVTMWVALATKRYGRYWRDVLPAPRERPGS